MKKGSDHMGEIYIPSTSGSEVFILRLKPFSAGKQIKKYI